MKRKREWLEQFDRQLPKNKVFNYYIVYDDVDIGFNTIDDLKTFFNYQSDDYFDDFFYWWYNDSSINFLAYSEPTYFLKELFFDDIEDKIKEIKENEINDKFIKETKRVYRLWR